VTDENRDVLGHLEKSAREFIAAARDALDIADEVLSERLRFFGAWFDPPPKPDPDKPKVEKIDVEDGPS